MEPLMSSLSRRNYQGVMYTTLIGDGTGRVMDISLLKYSILILQTSMMIQRLLTLITTVTIYLTGK